VNFVDDHQYIDRVLRGETAAYAFLVNQHKDMVFSLAFRITGNREDAEEVAQDTFMKAFRSLDKFRRKSKFSTWLYRITYNTAISRTREKRTDTLPLEVGQIESYSEEEIIENIDQLSDTEKSEMINEVLKKLNGREYMLVNLFYMEEHTVEEIGYIMGLSKSNVKVSLHRIRKKLFAELNDMNPV
jgi:RNA polymerase sigma factor (sigma-70 family)